MLGPSTPLALAVLPLLWILIGLGLWLTPTCCLVALGAWQLQPLIALAFTKIHSRDLIPVRCFACRSSSTSSCARCSAVITLPTPIAPSTRKLTWRAAPRRSSEPRRETCPVCEARELVVHLRSHDLLQHKPGRFALERCRGCRHVFQNPRLSLAGLDYYYKDFYDGLGESGMEFIFGFGVRGAVSRTHAWMVRDSYGRRRGAGSMSARGHGHFCIAALAELPDTTFDGLDLSESIEEAKRRGWVETAYRGLFPELAPTLAGRYDAISMSHYLEHTLDPRAELEAAHTALAANGCLLIEVPDPEFVLGRASCDATGCRGFRAAAPESAVR